MFDLRQLEAVEAILPDLLLDDSAWESLDIDYESPRVERLWRQLGRNRVCLHRIHPCKAALYHPHPWPSIVRIVSGEYEMGIGYGCDDEPPPVAAVVTLTKGSTYVMNDRNGWHYVKPTRCPSLSLMITGSPWVLLGEGRRSHGPTKPLEKLAEEDKTRLLTIFREAYPVL